MNGIHVGRSLRLVGLAFLLVVGQAWFVGALASRPTTHIQDILGQSLQSVFAEAGRPGAVVLSGRVGPVTSDCSATVSFAFAASTIGDQHCEYCWMLDWPHSCYEPECGGSRICRYVGFLAGCQAYYPPRCSCPQDEECLVPCGE